MSYKQDKIPVIGDKEAVFYGEAQRTAGGLYRADLMENSRGKIVSIKQHIAGLKKGAQHLPIKQSGGFSWPHLHGHLRADLQR